VLIIVVLDLKLVTATLADEIDLENFLLADPTCRRVRY